MAPNNSKAYMAYHPAPSASATASMGSGVLAAAGLAAYYSKARQSGSVPVDYTPQKFVKKPAGAKPGMVIYTTNKTLFVTPALPGEDCESKGD